MLIQNPSRPRRGFVLLTTLLLLMLVAAALTSACRISLREALAAQAAERALQMRWATLSCQQTLLPECETILVQNAAVTRSASASCHRMIQLNGYEIELVFGDELAKTNAASLFQRLGKSDAQIALRKLLSGTGSASLVHLRPARFTSPGDLKESAASSSNTNNASHSTVNTLADPPSIPTDVASGTLASLDSLFNSVTPAQLIHARYGPAPPAETITCWGDGRLNWARATEPALRLALAPPLDLNQVAKLLALRNSVPRVSLSSALDVLGLDGSQRNVAAMRLSDGSACHSLWVILKKEPDRTTYRLDVRDETIAPPRVSSFEW